MSVTARDHSEGPSGPEADNAQSAQESKNEHRQYEFQQAEGSLQTCFTGSLELAAPLHPPGRRPSTLRRSGSMAKTDVCMLADSALPIATPVADIGLHWCDFERLVAKL